SGSCGSHSTASSTSYQPTVSKPMPVPRETTPLRDGPSGNSGNGVIRRGDTNTGPSVWKAVSSPIIRSGLRLGRCLPALAAGSLLLGGGTALLRAAARSGLLAALLRRAGGVGDPGGPALRHPLLLERLVLLLVLHSGTLSTGHVCRHLAFRSLRGGYPTYDRGMRDAVICEPVRTPVGGFGGSLRDVPAHTLASTVIRALMERTGLPPDAVDDVILWHCYPTMDAPAIGRVAALDAGLPVTVTGIQIDRRCGSGLQAVLYAGMQVQSGVSDLVLAGGAESMSNAPFYSTAMRWGAGAGGGVMLHDALARGRVTAGGINFPVPGGMLETAENLRREYGIPRQE